MKITQNALQQRHKSLDPKIAGIHSSPNKQAPNCSNAASALPKIKQR